jgi:methyltransferase (TIGR00027 family)
MEERNPSRTALSVAALRAVHQRFDGEPKVLDDPLAERLIGPDWLAMLSREPERWGTPERTALRAHIVLRSRYAEDRLADAYRRGVRQAVILGAGYDTFAYRQPPWARDLRIVEIDHPGTQRDKRERLVRAGIAIPPNVALSPVDFEHTSLAEALPDAIDATQPAFFSWLGVIPYLGRDAIQQVFRAVAALPRGSEIVFSFAGPRTGEDPIEEAATAAGEPWLTRTSSDELAALLARIGYPETTFLTPDEVAVRYFSERTDDLRAPERTTVGSALV